MYWVTGCTLVQMGQADPAFLAIREGLTAAQKGDDPLLAATLRGSVAWQLLVQGRYEESHNVALEAAAAIEPAGEAGQDPLAVYGSLVLQGATAAGRSQKPGAALDLADAAGEVAARIGDAKHYECGFGPSQVVMQTTDIQISTEQYAEAVTAARAMPHGGAGLAPVSQARHLTDRAAPRRWPRLGEHRKALDLLLTAENIAGPEWVKYHSLLEQVVSELLDHDRRTPPRDLANRAGVHA